MKEGNLLLQPHTAALRCRVFLSNHSEQFTASTQRRKQRRDGERERGKTGSTEPQKQRKNRTKCKEGCGPSWEKREECHWMSKTVSGSHSHCLIQLVALHWVNLKEKQGDTLSQKCFIHLSRLSRTRVNTNDCPWLTSKWSWFSQSLVFTKCTR